MSIPSNLRRFVPTRALEYGFNGFAFSHFVLYTEPGCPPDLIMEPDFWAHQVAKFKPRAPGLPPAHLITVIALDGTFEADLRVMQIDPLGTWAAMRLLREWPLGIISKGTEHAYPTPLLAAKYPDADGYTVEFSGPQLWRIIRGGEVVAKDMPDEETATAALAQIKAARPGKRAA